MLSVHVYSGWKCHMWGSTVSTVMNEYCRPLHCYSIYTSLYVTGNYICLEHCKYRPTCPDLILMRTIGPRRPDEITE
jgi:hypothetical protein